MSVHEAAQRLVEVFGLKGLHVTELTVRAAVGEVPTITIKRNLLSAQEIDAVEQVFEIVLHDKGLTLREPATWQEWIEHEAKRIHDVVRKGFAEARRRAGIFY